MYFSKIAFFLPLFLSMTLAAPAPVAQEEVAEAHEVEAILAKRGFGCPNDYPCSEHVR